MSSPPVQNCLMETLVSDALGRPLRCLRVSVTDRCNLRCSYCMPADGIPLLARADLLHFGELAALVDAFVAVGVEKVRLTGGEPLIRKEVWRLVEMLAARSAIQDLALTTNGLLLSQQAADLFSAGLNRVTVSLDTLQEDRFHKFTRRDGLKQVLEGLNALQAVGFSGTKLDTVVIRGFNEDEILDMLQFAKNQNCEIRFIEYMDVAGALQWSMEQVVPKSEILRVIEETHGRIEVMDKEDWAPAQRFCLADGTVFGVISSTTEPFCQTCDRARLTSDGSWLSCLYADEGMNLGQALRAGATHQELVAQIRSSWSSRDDRGAEKRLEERERGPLCSAQDLNEKPSRGMSARGG